MLPLPVLYKSSTFLLLQKPAGLPLSGSKPNTLLKCLPLTLHPTPVPSTIRIILSAPRAICGPALLSLKPDSPTPTVVFTFHALVHGKVDLALLPSLEDLKIVSIIASTTGPLTVLSMRSKEPGTGLRKVLASAGYPVLGGGAGARQSGGCHTRRTHILCSRVEIAELDVDEQLGTSSLDRQIERERDFGERKARREGNEMRMGESGSGDHVGFMKWWFLVDENVMRPRRTSEVVVHTAVEYLKNGRVLDLGTGSGVLLCSTLLMSEGYGVGVEISVEAAEIARRNIESLGIEERGSVIVGDFGNGCDEIGKFDVVMSNPPYLSPGEIHGDKAKLEKEPIVAVCGGHDGMQGYVAVASSAVGLLVDGGVVIVEVGGKRDLGAIEGVFEREGLMLLETRVDWRGVKRVGVFRQGVGIGSGV